VPVVGHGLPTPENQGYPLSSDAPQTKVEEHPAKADSHPNSSDKHPTKADKHPTKVAKHPTKVASHQLSSHDPRF